MTILTQYALSVLFFSYNLDGSLARSQRLHKCIFGIWVLSPLFSNWHRSISMTTLLLPSDANIVYRCALLVHKITFSGQPLLTFFILLENENKGWDCINYVIVMRGYNSTLLCHCSFYFYMMGLLVCRYRPLWQEVNARVTV